MSVRRPSPYANPPSAITLSKIVARCRFCDYEAAQISATREHAVEVITEAMEQHAALAHPDLASRGYAAIGETP